MVAYQQHANLKSMLVKARLPNGSSKRRLTGMKTCGKDCVVCSYLKLAKSFRARKTRERIELTNLFNYNTKGVVYLTECLKCGIQYVGQTIRKFKDRIREHIGDIKNNRDTANGRHYNSKGHSVDDFRALIIERVVPNDGAWLLEREEMWIKRLETKKPNGLNRID